ncbi:MAG: hypothetical protein WCK67_00110 [bacterium]
MNKVNSLVERKPIKATVTRINNVFEQTNPYMTAPNQNVIKNYVYYPEKRIIA